MIIDTGEWITLGEAAELLGVSYQTLSAYIIRRQVIPKDKYLRVWSTVVLNRQWVLDRKKRLQKKKGR